jgi:anti-sigma factor RsiW
LNCRKVNSLLSAYIDAELTGEEMHAVSVHLNSCPTCRLEQESLQETKRLVASLALKAPREELESLLLMESEHAASPASRLWFPVTMWLDEVRERAASVATLPVRTRPLAATAMFSLAGLWLATASVDRHNGPALVNAPNFSGAVVTADITGSPLSSLTTPPPMMLPVPEMPRVSRVYNDRAFLPMSSRHANDRTYIPASFAPPGLDTRANILFNLRNDYGTGSVRWAH